MELVKMYSVLRFITLVMITVPVLTLIAYLVGVATIELFYFSIIVQMIISTVCYTIGRKSNKEYMIKNPT